MAFPWDVITEANVATGAIVEDLKLGLELAIAEVNAGGGILRRRVELLIADDDGSPAPGAAAALARAFRQVEPGFRIKQLVSVAGADS